MGTHFVLHVHVSMSLSTAVPHIETTNTLKGGLYATVYLTDESFDIIQSEMKVTR